MTTKLEQDYIRYGENRHHMPRFQYYFRKTQECNFKPLKLLYKALMVYHRKNMAMKYTPTVRLAAACIWDTPMES